MPLISKSLALQIFYSCRGEWETVSIATEPFHFSPDKSMKAIVISIVVLALLPFANADEPIANRTQTETAFARELHHATDIAIISRLSLGGYRVLSVIKGESFAAADDVEFGSSFDFSSRIPIDLRKEPRLLVWQAGNQCGVANIALPRTSIGAVPFSAGGEVSVSPAVKVSLASILFQFRPIEVGIPIQHPAAIGPELANKRHSNRH